MTEIFLRGGGLDDPQVQALLAVHVAFGRADRPAENAHVLTPDGLAGPAITFWSAWSGNALAGFVALKELVPGPDNGWGELKSMRTAPAFLRRGVARLLLAQVIATARARGYRRLSLETGSTPPFDPANRLYEAAGFADCAAFGGYPDSPLNRFMTMML